MMARTGMALEEEATMEHARIRTTGMHCPSCSMLVEMDVSELPGVRDVTASVADSLTCVEFDPSEVSVEKIKKKSKMKEDEQ